jgi:hypothetical protein
LGFVAACLVAACLLPAAFAGCGEQGIGEGAAASVYVTAPLCGGAGRELAQDGASTGEVRLRVKCLPEASDLAAIGAGARRAVEDSSTIAYIGPTDRKPIEFSETILEEAAIPRIPTSSGATAMDQLIQAVAEAGDTSNLRESVNKSLSSN